MNWIFRYSPLLSLLLILANGGFLAIKAKRLGAREQTRRPGYRRIATNFTVYGGGIAALWATGAAFGVATVPTGPWGPSVMEPRTPSTWFDWLFLAVTFVIFSRFSLWLYRRQGAEYLTEHNALFSGIPHTPAEAKITWALLFIVSVGSLAYRLAV